MTLADTPVSSPETSYSMDPDAVHQWDINDNLLPTILECEPYNSWPNGHSKAVYCEDISEEARRHASGWAMRNTNNHKVEILKKSCLGVLVCSKKCIFENGDTVHMRPAICDKARRKQLGKQCPNPRCGEGHLELQACRGHCGYPVTHFWRHIHGRVFFQAKGVHDHLAPDLKTSVDGRRSNPRSPGHYERQRGVTRKRIASRDLMYNEKLPHLDFSQSNIVTRACGCGPYQCQCAQPLCTAPFIQLDELNYFVQSSPTSATSLETCSSSSSSSSSSSTATTTAITSGSNVNGFDINESFKAACAEFTSGFLPDIEFTSEDLGVANDAKNDSFPSCMYSSESGMPSFDKFADTDCPLYGATIASNFLIGDFEASLNHSSNTTTSATSNIDHIDDELSLNLPAITSFLDEDLDHSDVHDWGSLICKNEPYSALLQASNSLNETFSMDCREMVHGFS